MLRAVSYLPLALLFLASAVPSNGQNTETSTLAAEEVARAGEAFDGDVKYYDVRGKIELYCNIGGSISWKKNGTSIGAYPELKDHVITKPLFGVENAALTLAARATEDDFGNYTCSNGAREMNWIVLARPHAKMSPDSNVVEGQKLKLNCKIIGKPRPAVEWMYSNTSETVENGTEVTVAFGDRLKLVKSEQGVENGDLIIDSALRSDAGWYRCKPLADKKANATMAITRLRVKDMYAALWPFLGICAEVFILCAIILVYEKRRTKPELDDSDTDNHEQKKS